MSDSPTNPPHLASDLTRFVLVVALVAAVIVGLWFAEQRFHVLQWLIDQVFRKLVG